MFRKRPSRICSSCVCLPNTFHRGRGGPAARLPRRLLLALVAVQILAVGGLLVPDVPLLRGAGARLGRWFAGLHGNDVALALSWAGFVATGLAGALLLFLMVVLVWRARRSSIRPEPSRKDDGMKSEGAGVGAVARDSSPETVVAVTAIAWALLGFFLVAHATHTLGAVPLLRWLVRPSQCTRWPRLEQAPSSSIRSPPLPGGGLRPRSGSLDADHPDIHPSAAEAGAVRTSRVPHVCLVTGPITAEPTTGVPAAADERFRSAARTVLAQKVEYAKSHPHTSVFTFDRAFIEGEKVSSQIPKRLRRFWAKPASLLEVMTRAEDMAKSGRSGRVSLDWPQIAATSLPKLADAGTYMSRWGSGACEWVVWMDLDTVIMTPERPLQSLVDGFEAAADGDGFDVVIGDEAGMVFLRNGPATVSLVRQWLGTPAGHPHGDGLDDGALQHLLAEGSAAGTLRVRRAAPCEFNAYFHFWDIAHRWTCGDFAVHTAGDLWKMDRLPMLVEMARAGQCRPPWAWNWK